MTKKLLTLLFSMLLIVSLSYSQGTTKEEKQLYERLMKSKGTVALRFFASSHIINGLGGFAVLS